MTPSLSPLLASTATLVLAAVVCRDAQRGEREGDPRPRYSDAQVAGWLDYIRLDTPQSVYAALNKLWAHQPVLLQGSPLVAGLAGVWSFDQLVRAAAKQGMPSIPVVWWHIQIGPACSVAS